MLTHRYLPTAAFALAACVFGMPAEAAAQPSFTYQAFTADVEVPLVMTDEEFIQDAYVASGSRYGANLDQRRRILANGYATHARLGFSSIQLNSMAVDGVNDFVSLGWNSGSFVSTKTGTWGSTDLAVNGLFNPALNAYESLLSMPLVYRFRAGPSSNSSDSSWFESEADGYRSSFIRISNNGGLRSSAVAPLAAHQRVMGVLLPFDDTVDMVLPSVSTPVTVTMWLDNPTSSNVRIYARCGAFPAPGAFDQYRPTRDGTWFPRQEGAWLSLPVCSSRWFLSVTSTDPSVRVFHLLWGTNEAGRDFRSIRVGVSWNATSTELQQIRDSFREAAWLVYGISGGTVRLSDFRIVNDANQCDDGGWISNFACEGTDCNYCIRQDCGGRRSWYDSVTGMVTMCPSEDGISLPTWRQPNVIAHESGHMYMGLADEYDEFNWPDYTPTCPARDIWGLCGHSLMSDYYNNKWSVCTSLGHSTIQEDWRGMSNPTPWPPDRVINGPNAYDCAGHAFSNSASAAWATINAYAPLDHPMSLSPHNHRFPNFWGYGWVGAFSRTQ